MRKTLIAVIVALPFYLSAQTLQNFPPLQGEYLGQKTPDNIPEIFAKDIVSDSTWAEHCQIAISPKGDEIYWSAYSRKYRHIDGKSNTQQIYFSKLENAYWTKPALAEFVKDYLTNTNAEPAFSPDGNRLYFNSDRSGGLGGIDVWYVERENEKWSKPINVGTPYNSINNDPSPFFTKKGNAYCMGNYQITPDVKPIKFTYKNNSFGDSTIVKIHPDFYPFYSIYVSPDEDYMIFSGYHYLGIGELDLYICYKDEHGNWGYPVILRDHINTETTERFPVVSPDGKYLFFVRHRNNQNFYWVSTETLEKYRNESIEKSKTPSYFKAIKLKPEEIDKYLGVYSCSELPFKTTISNEENELKVNVPGRPSFLLECYGKNKFKYDQQMLKIEFFPDDNTMFLHGGSEKFRLKKENL